MGVKRDCTCPRASHKHGTTAAYNADGCRCQPCTRANTRYKNLQRLRRIEAVRAGTVDSWTTSHGTRRRLQALAAVGWSTTEIGKRLGVTQQCVSELRSYPGNVFTSTAARIARLYDELWDKPPTGTPGGIGYCRKVAADRGWAVPLSWDDDEIDNPAASPHLHEESRTRELKPCGTVAAARRHHRRKEPLCIPCRRAVARDRGGVGRSIAS